MRKFYIVYIATVAILLFLVSCVVLYAVVTPPDEAKIEVKDRILEDYRFSQSLLDDYAKNHNNSPCSLKQLHDSIPNSVDSHRFEKISTSLHIIYAERPRLLLTCNHFVSSHDCVLTLNDAEHSRLLFLGHKASCMDDDIFVVRHPNSNFYSDLLRVYSTKN